MKEITLGGKKEIPVLKVNIGDQAYSVPLAGSMTPKQIASLDTQAKTVEFFKQFIPEEVADQLTISDWNELVLAWGEASQADSNMTPGESSASRSS